MPRLCVMDDFQLERFCERNKQCGCRCMSCPAFQANIRYHDGYTDEDDEDEDDC